MSIEEMKEIIMNEVPFSELQKDKGIYEFHENGEKSLGISYESGIDFDERTDVYVYNVFIGEEYINVSGYGTKENRLPEEVLNELVKEWNLSIVS